MISRTQLQSECVMDRVQLILQVDNGQLIGVKFSTLQVWKQQCERVPLVIFSTFLSSSFIFVHLYNLSYLLMSLKYVFYLISVICLSVNLVLSGISVRPFVRLSFHPFVLQSIYLSWQAGVWIRTPGVIYTQMPGLCLRLGHDRFHVFSKSFTIQGVTGRCIAQSTESVDEGMNWLIWLVDWR